MGMMKQSDEDLSEIIAVFNNEEFLELAVDDVGVTADLLTRFVFTTLHHTSYNITHRYLTKTLSTTQHTDTFSITTHRYILNNNIQIHSQ